MTIAPLDPHAIEARITALERELAEAHEAFESVVFGLAAALFEPDLPDELRQNARMIPLMPCGVGTTEERARIEDGRMLAGFILGAIADRLDAVAKISASMPPSTSTPQ